MKNIVYSLLGFIIYQVVSAQAPDYSQKLYYTCKIWGFVKYFHSKVSDCQVEWDTVLARTLPLVKKSANFNEFNDALYQMILAAGEMNRPKTLLPDTLPAELKRNRNFSWFNDSLIRNDVKALLDTIRINFVPKANCWVREDNPNNNSWFWFPYDDPLTNKWMSVYFPDEFTRISIIFRYWNIINYFNPYNYILDNPWDSTIARSIIPISNAKDVDEFYKIFKKMTACLNDGHAEGWTWNRKAAYYPNLILRYVEGNYVVVKTSYPEISFGDIILSVDGMTVKQWEDSLKPYISAGNEAYFKVNVSYKMLRGEQDSPFEIEFSDSLGLKKKIIGKRELESGSNWLSDYRFSYLDTVKWKKWSCGTGYVNMFNLWQSNVNSMYTDLKDTKAIIFDVRKSTKGAGREIANKMYQNTKSFSLFTIPDVSYPGTYYYSLNYLGYENNPEYYRGKVIILCSELTGSEAEYCCMMLRAMPNSIVVGSQTAGTDGNITYFYISQEIRTGFTSLGVYYPDGTPTQRTGIVPDSVVTPTIAGLRQGRDEVLDKALEIAGCLSGAEKEKRENQGSSVKIYPNPVTDIINISFENIKSESCVIKIFDRLGNHINTLNIEHSLSKVGTVQWNCTDFNNNLVPDGIYFLRINTGSEVICRAVVVVH